jgi:AraC family transcriptional regulator, glycine betaine-responsive activator
MNSSAEPMSRRVGFILFPGFSLIAFASAIEPLRVANMLSPHPLYRFVLASPRKGLVQASNAIPMTAEYDLSDIPACDIVVLCAGYGGEYIEDEALYAWLRKLARQGVMLVGMGTGTYLLARAKLLNGRRCTVHWENIASVAEEFPGLDVSDKVFVQDGHFVTCCGGTGSMDMMLEIIGQQNGCKLARGIADQLVCAPTRKPGDRQLANPDRFGTLNPELATVLNLMEANLEQTLSLNSLAARAGISVRQIQRLFQALLRVSPGQYYLELRLNRARALLIQSTLSIAKIAAGCGFSSTSHLSAYYKRFHGISPLNERKALQSSADKGVYVASALQRKDLLIRTAPERIPEKRSA